MLEFRERLLNHLDFFSLLACFDPNSEKFLASDAVVALAKRYQSSMSDGDIEILPSQAATAKRMVQSSTRVKSILDFYGELNNLPTAFDALIKLVTIVITLPVSTASNERIFSVLGDSLFLKKIKKKFRLKRLLVIKQITCKQITALSLLKLNF